MKLATPEGNPFSPDFNDLGERTTVKTCLESVGVSQALANPDDPPEKQNAAPSAKGNGAQSNYEATKLQGQEYAHRADPATEYRLADEGDARPVEVEDGSKSFKLASGFTLEVECDETGLMDGRDFLLASGAVIRFEKRIVQVLPPVNWGN